jgi:hypothetical protein
MTQDMDAEAIDAQDESGVIKALRSQIKDLEKDLKSRPDRDTLEAEFLTQQERNSAISSQLVDLGHPAGMSAIIAEKMGEGDVTRESVTATLQGLGYNLEATPETAPDPSETSESDQALAEVTSLSSQVASAAGNPPADDTMAKIAATETREELAALMAEKGLTEQHTG